MLSLNLGFDQNLAAQNGLELPCPSTTGAATQIGGPRSQHEQGCQVPVTPFSGSCAEPRFSCHTAKDPLATVRVIPLSTGSQKNDILVANKPRAAFGEPR